MTSQGCVAFNLERGQAHLPNLQISVSLRVPLDWIWTNHALLMGGIRRGVGDRRNCYFCFIDFVGVGVDKHRTPKLDHRIAREHGGSNSYSIGAQVSSDNLCGFKAWLKCATFGFLNDGVKN